MLIPSLYEFDYNLRRRYESNAFDESKKLREHFKYIKVLPQGKSYCRVIHHLLTVPPDDYIVAFSKIVPPPGDQTIDYSRYVYVRGCLRVQMAHMDVFDRPVHTPHQRFDRAVELATSIVTKLMAIPEKLEFPKEQALHTVKFYPNKFSGIEYATKGFRTREKANPLATSDALQALRKLMAGIHVQPHDVRLGGCGKFTKVPPGQSLTEPPAVGRLILMLSHRDLKICAITEELLTEAYVSEKYPISLGQTWFRQGSSRFLDRFADYDKWACFDAKKFDASINPWMVDTAVSVLRKQFVNGTSPIYDSYWYFIRESLIRAPIFRDDGVRLQREVGTTSGHSYNTMIQSIITLILGYAVLAELNPEMDEEALLKHARIESLGDDNIMGLRGPLKRHTKNEIAMLMQLMFNIDWSGPKSFMTETKVDLTPEGFKGIQYLGKYWYMQDTSELGVPGIHPLPYRPSSETYLRMLLPSYGKTGNVDQTWLRAIGHYIDGAGNPETRAWLDKLLDWLEPQLSMRPEDLEWPNGVQRSVMRTFMQGDQTIPPTRRFSVVEWLGLVTTPPSENGDIFNILHEAGE